MSLRLWVVVAIAVLNAGCGTPPSSLVITQSSAGAFDAALRARNGGFVVAWYDTRDGNAEIYMRLLDESGRPAGPERRLTNSPEDSYEPSLAVAGDAVIIAWYDKSRDGTLVAQLGAWDFDGQNRWMTTIADGARNPVLARHASDIFCAWIAAGADGRESVWGAWFAETAPSTFTPLLLGRAGRTTWNLNAIALEGRTAVVVYDAVAGTQANEIFLADVTPTRTGLTRLTPDDGVPSKYPDISAAAYEAVTWFDERDGNEEVYLKVGSRSAVRDPAVGARRVTATPGASIGAYVAWVEGSGAERIGLAWSDDTEGQHEVYFQPFTAGGEPLAPARRVTNTVIASLIPAIVPFGDRFGLAWNEYTPAAGSKPSSSQIAFTIVR